MIAGGDSGRGRIDYGMIAKNLGIGSSSYTIPNDPKNIRAHLLKLGESLVPTVEKACTGNPTIGPDLTCNSGTLNYLLTIGNPRHPQGIVRILGYAGLLRLPGNMTVSDAFAPKWAFEPGESGTFETRPRWKGPAVPAGVIPLTNRGEAITIANRSRFFLDNIEVMDGNPPDIAVELRGSEDEQEQHTNVRYYLEGQRVGISVIPGNYNAERIDQNYSIGKKEDVGFVREILRVISKALVIADFYSDKNKNIKPSQDIKANLAWAADKVIQARAGVQ